MHDRELVRVLERVGDLRGQVGGGLQRDALRVLEHLLQRAALEQLHRDISDAVLLAHVVDDDDVGVIEPAGGARFAQEALPHLGHHLLRQIGKQRLQRDLALDQRVDGAEHRAHRAASQLSQDPVTAKLLCVQPRLLPYLRSA